MDVLLFTLIFSIRALFGFAIFYIIKILSFKNTEMEILIMIRILELLNNILNCEAKFLFRKNGFYILGYKCSVI